MLDSNYQPSAAGPQALTPPGESVAAQRPHEFLAEASVLLASSLDYETVVEQLVRLAVPALADWCVVHRLEDVGAITPVAIAHVDPQQELLVRSLCAEYPDLLDQSGLVPQSLRAESSVITPVLTDADLSAAARDERHLALLRALELRSQMCVPMVARGNVLGAIAFHATAPGRFGQPDLELAEDLARRAALAADNARLYRDAQQSRELSTRLGRILDDASDEIYIVDARTLRIQQANGTACASTGYSRDEVRQLTLLDLSAELTPSTLAEALRPLWLGAQDTVSFESVHRRKDGTCYPADTRVRLSQTEVPPVLIAIAGNASARKAAERRLAVQHGATEALAVADSEREAATEVLRVIATRLEWDFGAWWTIDYRAGALACDTTWSADLPAVEPFAAASRGTTFQRGQGLLGRVWAAGVPLWLEDVFHERDFARSRPAIRASLRSGFAFPIRSRGEVLGVVELFTRQRHAEDGALLRVVAGLGIQIGHFVERHRAQAALRERNERYRSLAVENARLYREAQQAIHARDEFLAVVSHDLKNPLVTIKGRAQMLQRRLAKEHPNANPRIQSDLTSIDATVTKMTTQINELLDISRAQMESRLDLVREQTDLVALLRRVVDDNRQASERHQFRLTTSLPALHGAWDAARLERVAANLISNAIKYSPDGGVISLDIWQEERAGARWAIFTVADTGIGIPAADLPKVFERFQRAGNVSGIAGTGVGLVGARQIVEQHGGEISVESQEGRGSTFTVSLPVESGD